MPMVNRCVMLATTAALWWSGLAASTPAPDYIPICPNPQITAPTQTGGGVSIYRRSPIVWNGKDYGVVWVDYTDSRLYFRRFFADGTPAGPVARASSLVSAPLFSPSLVWTGTEYGVAWMAESPFHTQQIYFARLDATGTLVGSEVKASLVGVTNEPFSCYYPALAWSGGGYAVAWNDPRNAAMGIFATLLNSDGTIANGGVSHDLLVCYAGGGQECPTIAWSTASGRYVIAWQDSRSTTHSEIWASNLAPNGAVFGPLLEVSSTDNSRFPSLADMGNGLGMVWQDTRDVSTEIYYARLDAIGFKLGDDLRLTNDTSDSFYPTIVWTGTEFGIFWNDWRTGNFEDWFQRVSGGGVAIGANVQVTTSVDSRYASAAFARYGFLTTFANYGFANFLQAWGCATDTTPPSCPGGFVAYNITGTSATIGWLPSGDPETDMAYYIVYRNAVAIAKTSDTTYADSGLFAGGTYAYSVEPVNAAQLQNYACQTTFYVKTNATLLLKVDKSDHSALLTWTDASMSNCNVFRGVSPQSMTLIGTSSTQSYTDLNALTDTILYFYTVDEPGW